MLPAQADRQQYEINYINVYSNSTSGGKATEPTGAASPTTTITAGVPSGSAGAGSAKGSGNDARANAGRPRESRLWEGIGRGGGGGGRWGGGEGGGGGGGGGGCGGGAGSGNGVVAVRGGSMDIVCIAAMNVRVVELDWSYHPNRVLQGTKRNWGTPKTPKPGTTPNLFEAKSGMRRRMTV